MERNADIAAICSGDGYTSRPDVTPESHPDHHTVGRDFMAHGYPENEWKTTRWFCVCHDQGGYWMFATDGSGQWANVSERAIDRTYHTVYRDGHGEWSQWGPTPPYMATARHAEWTARREAR
jgi:hypothetical protein